MHHALPTARVCYRRVPATPTLWATQTDYHAHAHNSCCGFFFFIFPKCKLEGWFFFLLSWSAVSYSSCRVRFPPGRSARWVHKELMQRAGAAVLRNFSLLELPQGVISAAGIISEATVYCCFHHDGSCALTWASQSWDTARVSLELYSRKWPLNFAPAVSLISVAIEMVHWQL